MMNPIYNYYIKISTEKIDNQIVNSWYSEIINDENWDEFVFSNDQLIYEQSSLWSAIKKLEKWNCIRVIYTNQSGIIGGYQIFYRNLRLKIRYGYLNRGPLLKFSNEEYHNFFVRTLNWIVKRYKIRFLLFYPHYNFRMPKLHYALPNKLVKVDEAHFYVDLNNSPEELLKKMMRMRRQNIKKSLANGIKIREGGKNELKLFFSFMLKTCERQCVKPNPANEIILENIWELFNTRGLINLYLIEYENTIIAGCLTLKHKDKFIAWKSGWTGLHKEIKPNDGMHWLLILKAKELGFRYYDFRGVELELYNEIKNSTNPLSKVALSSPTFFKFGFNGDIKVFPESIIIVNNIVLRNFMKFYYFICLKLPSFKRFFEKSLKFNDLQH